MSRKRSVKKDEIRLAPFIHTEKNAPYIYLTLIAAMVPCAIYGAFYYGLRAIILIIFCMVTFTLSDLLFTRIAGRGGKGEYFDLSSASSGLMLALILPPDTSLVTALAAVLFGSRDLRSDFSEIPRNIRHPSRPVPPAGFPPPEKNSCISRKYPMGKFLNYSMHRFLNYPIRKSQNYSMRKLLFL